MKTRNFYVHPDSIVEFAEMLQEGELDGSITGVNENDEIEIAVSYESENSETVLSLIEFVENIESVLEEDEL